MEQMLPSAMVPGLVTIKNKKGQTQNVWPIDAKELIGSGEYTLVENGSAEAARLNVNPLRSGRAVADPNLVIAEVAGLAGSVVVGADEKAAEQAISEGDNADAVTPKPDPKTETKTEQESGKEPLKNQAPAQGAGKNDGKADDKK